MPEAFNVIFMASSFIERQTQNSMKTLTYAFSSLDLFPVLNLAGPIVAQLGQNVFIS